ncbi:MAG: flippase-like domain-containing protein [Chloroflexi bacterium]|nr:flippase-like domain-containing protein [Chloroflexota bacterium]
MSSKAGKILGVIVTLVCLGLAFYKVDLRGLGQALASANYWLILPALAVWLLGYVVRTARWRVILAEAVRCSFVTLFGVLMIGFATNNVLPARLGELARAFLLRRRTSVRKTFLLASIFLERVFDGLVLVALMSVLSLGIDLPGWGHDVERIASLLFFGVALGVILLLARRDLAERLLALVLRPFPDRLSHWTSGAFGAFMKGLSTMQRPSVLAKTALLSVVVWSLEWAAYYLVTGAFDLGLSPTTRAAACGVLLVVVNLGIMLPAAPGYVGTFQFFAVAALAVFGVQREQALAVAIVAHATQYVLVTAIGLAFFGREHVSLGTLTQDARSDSPAATPTLAEPAAAANEVVS